MINKSKLMLIGTVMALLAGGSSLGFAQTAPTTGGLSDDVYRLPNGAAAYKPIGHNNLYMSAKVGHHKGSLKTSRQSLEKQ